MTTFTSVARGEGEPFEDYKLRRKLSNIETAMLKYGTMFWDSLQRGTYENKARQRSKKRDAHIYN
jgi:hypothetical protein